MDSMFFGAFCLVLVFLSCYLSCNFCLLVCFDFLSFLFFLFSLKERTDMKVDVSRSVGENLDKLEGEI